MAAGVAWWLARRTGSRWRELVGDPGRALRGAAIGLGIALAAAVAAALGLALLAGAFGIELVLEEIDAIATPGSAAVAGLAFLVRTSLPEEVIFRGVLHTLWARTLTGGRAVAATSAAFALWHIVVQWQTLAAVVLTDRPVLFVLAYVGALAAVGVAGVVLGFLRARNGSLAGPIVAHWLLVGALSAAVRLT